MIITKQRKDDILKFISSIMNKTHLIDSLTLEVHESFNDTYNPEEEEWLSLANLSSDWPPAVDPSLIVQSEEDKEIRAESILTLFANKNVENKKICDFDCHEGHLVRACTNNKASLAVGLDIFNKIELESKENQIFTQDIQIVKKNAPYDIIFMYDFLDHVEDPVSYLIIARDCLKPDGRIYIRFHPWCSRHGGHTYKKINKAFIHFFVSEQTLLNMNDGKPCPQKVIHPINTYDKWIREAQLTKKEKEVVIPQPIEKYFRTPKMAYIIAKNFSQSPNSDIRTGKKFPDVQTSMQFLDYTLGK